MTRLFSGWLHDIALSGAFLTRLPFRPGGNVQAAELSRAMRAFPLVGLLIGGFAGGALWIAAQTNLPPLVCAFIGLIISAWITCALHEDGLADVADGMGERDKARRLEIMRDPRIGTYGVMALILAVGLKASILAGLPGPGVTWSTMIAAAALSRAVMAPCMVLISPARADGLGHGAGRPDVSCVFQSLVLGGVAAIAILGSAMGLAAVSGSLLAMGLTAWLAHARFGGYTGDVLGAVQQVAEIFILCAVGAILP